MGLSNVSPEAEGVLVDNRLELALYDAMPRRFRVLIDSLPVLQRVSKVEEYRRALGDDAAYERVVEAFRRQFPGWEPP